MEQPIIHHVPLSLCQSFRQEMDEIINLLLTLQCVSMHLALQLLLMFLMRFKIRFIIFMLFLSMQVGCTFLLWTGHHEEFNLHGQNLALYKDSHGYIASNTKNS